MNNLGPVPKLLQVYGSDVYRSQLSKLAAPEPHRVAGPLATALIMRLQGRNERQQEIEAHLLTQLFRQQEGERQARLIAGLQGQGQSLSVQGEAVRSMLPMAAYRAMSDLQSEGMTRYASAAGKALSKMAMKGLRKEAIGNPVAIFGKALGGSALKAKKALTPGWKTKALGAGAVAGAGVGTYKGLGAAKDYLVQPTYASNNWGGQGLGTSSGINMYGHTDVVR